MFDERGVKIEKTYQLNFGGNTDFLNMLERERLESKKISKTGAVTSQIPYQLNPGDIHVGPSDHIPFLKDRKFCEIRIEGTTFGNVPLLLRASMEVWDSPNSAGVVIDAVRCAKLALDRGLCGQIEGPSSYFFKTPPRQFKDSECWQKVQEYISEENSL
jgi:myo-inositol-1-phosphate synthase